MGKKNKYRLTHLRKNNNCRLTISEDPDKEETKILITWIPYLNAFAHEHIELSVAEAKKLNKWLNKFLEKHES